VTEFLPVSSSGHLVIIAKILKVEECVLLATVLHAGTLVSIIIVYLRELRNLFGGDKKLLKFIFVSSIPAGAAGLTLNYFGLDKLLFENAALVGCGFFVTSASLYCLTKNQSQTKDISDMNFKDAFLIGLAQCVAIMPGISRSGMTISSALHLNYKRKDASTYSFLMAVPVIGGAAFIEILPSLKDMSKGEAGIGSLSLIIGFTVSAIVGYIALNAIIESVRKGSLKNYAIYCFILGVIVLTVELARYL
jgi:undecaprenyl-diphosphatase